MAKCKEIDYIMSLYLDGEMTEEERSDFEAHIISCDNCKKVFDEYKTLFSEVKQLPEYELPEGFHQRVMAGIEIENNKKIIYSPMFFKRIVPVAASMAGMFVLLSTIIHSIQLEPSSVEQQIGHMSARSFTGITEDIQIYEGESGMLAQSEQYSGIENQEFSGPEIDFYNEPIMEGPETQRHSGISFEEATGIIKHYSISISVDNVEGARQALLNLGGTLEREYGYEDTAGLTKRIQAENYDQFIAEIRTLGDIIYINEFVSDFRVDINNLQSRMNTLTEERERLTQLIISAETVRDIVALEQRIQSVENQINELHFQLEDYYYNEQWPSVSINLTVRHGYEESSSSSMPQRIRESFIGSINATARGMEYILFGAVYLFIPAVVLLLVYTFVYLIRKYINRKNGGGN